MRYFVIGDEDSVVGFRLAGVDGVVVDNRADAEASFDAVLEDNDYGIIIITERIAEIIRDRVDRYVFAEQFPLILEIPDRTGRLEGRLGMREMVNKAIGISM